ncbi:PilN domain-containing protein [Acinetobacter stercoris]|uniref:Fimbrial assembly protein (PilN) n=1 Tax=Acinetobacter stercoris TaxID=2126983 RepID=A0A2U3MTU3_9GAMM|nr:MULTISPECIES: PilN domain-containing protein [Acinetobacter]SPL68832.1 Fimbrial assembly protein (PilN) [Acinetobacter stercoris]
MAKINLLPWREELREQRKKQFILTCIGVSVVGLLVVVLMWFINDYRLRDQEQANQLIQSRNQGLDAELKSLDGLHEKRDAIIERMKLIQGLESQRPVSVRLFDELARVTPANVYLTKFTRTDNKFTIEGKAESPNAVADFMRALGASQWYRNVFMSSFVAYDESKNKEESSVVPRVEEKYGSFIVTADLGEIAVMTSEMPAAQHQAEVKK